MGSSPCLAWACKRGSRASARPRRLRLSPWICVTFPESLSCPRTTSSDLDLSRMLDAFNTALSQLCHSAHATHQCKPFDGPAIMLIYSWHIRQKLVKRRRQVRLIDCPRGRYL